MFCEVNTGALSAVEKRVLKHAGLNPLEPGVPDPLSRTEAEHYALLKSSLTVKQAADMLGVSVSRVRQMLTGTPRRLYGIRGRTGWKVPAFQFAEGNLVPGWDEVAGHIDPALSPVAVARWATQPSPDLVVDGEPVSPITWLMSGGRATAVTEVADNL